MEFVAIAWQALAFTFALMPAIAAFAYFYDCGYQRKPARLRGYFSFLASLGRAKREAYEETARLVFPLGPGGAVLLLGWAFALIVLLVGPGLLFIGFVYVAAIPLSILGYVIGKARSKDRER